MKGDVSLIKLNEKRDISFSEIVNLKNKLLDGINNGTDERCNGCPYLKYDNWENVEDEKVGCIDSAQ